MGHIYQGTGIAFPATSLCQSCQPGSVHLILPNDGSGPWTIPFAHCQVTDQSRLIINVPVAREICSHHHCAGWDNRAHARPPLLDMNGNPRLFEHRIISLNPLASVHSPGYRQLQCLYEDGEGVPIIAVITTLTNAYYSIWSASGSANLLWDWDSSLLHAA